MAKKLATTTNYLPVTDPKFPKIFGSRIIFSKYGRQKCLLLVTMNTSQVIVVAAEGIAAQVSTDIPGHGPVFVLANVGIQTKKFETITFELVMVWWTMAYW